MSRFDGENARAFLAGRRGAGIIEGQAVDGRLGAGLAAGPAVASSYAVNEHWLGDFTKLSPISAYSWRVTDIFGGVTPAPTNPSAATERGILRCATGTGVADGGTVALPQPTFSGVEDGTLCVCKMRIDGTETQMISWSGFASSLTGTPLIATGMEFMGIRAISGGATANWHLVAKDGAASESTLDLGVAADGTWRILAFRKLPTSVVGYVVNATDRDRGPVFRRVGTVTANFPTAGLRPVAMGVVSALGGSRFLDQDFFSIGGGVAA